MNNRQKKTKQIENDILQTPAEFEQSQIEYIHALEMSVQLLQREVENLRNQNLPADSDNRENTFCST